MIEPHILEVLTKLQANKKSIIVGGYLRDHYCGISPHDVDIATEMSIDEVKKIFPQLNGTERGLAFGIGRFTYKQTLFEISTHPEEPVLDSIATRDFTINSLYFDGTTIHDEHGAIEDIRKKIVRSLESPAIHFEKKPEAYLRAIRLTGQTGFDLANDLILFMHQNKGYFEQVNTNRIQQEGYRILQSDFPLKAFYTLQELQFIQKDLAFNDSIKIPMLSNQLDIRIAYLASVVGVEVMYAFIDLFQLSKRMKDKTYYLIPYFDEHPHVTNPYIINDIILLKRYQFNNDQEKLRAYLQTMKK